MLRVFSFVAFVEARSRTGERERETGEKSEQHHHDAVGDRAYTGSHGGEDDLGDVDEVVPTHGYVPLHI